MPDENGETIPGELVSGGYGALEGDLGYRLRPLAGFGRDFEEPEEEEAWSGVVFTPEGHRTSSGSVVYTLARRDWEL